MNDSPLFPLRIRWVDSGEVDEYVDDEELMFNLEEFDSSNPADREAAIVHDSLGRKVDLLVSLINGRCESTLSGERRGGHESGETAEESRDDGTSEAGPADRPSSG